MTSLTLNLISNYYDFNAKLKKEKKFQINQEDE